MTLPIIVPTMSHACPGTLAMVTEGLEVTEITLRDNCNYGRLIINQWVTRKGFILVEHDIVPWPGAISELQECDENWCVFQYPMFPIEKIGLVSSLGCMKFSRDLTMKHEFDSAWEFIEWNVLDGHVTSYLQNRGEVMHVHTPPVAHVKAQHTIFRSA